MTFAEAVFRGMGYARKMAKGNKYWVQRVGDKYIVNLGHRSGSRKVIDKLINAQVVAIKYGSEGWEPGM